MSTGWLCMRTTVSIMVNQSLMDMGFFGSPKIVIALGLTGVGRGLVGCVGTVGWSGAATSTERVASAERMIGDVRDTSDVC